MHEIQRLAGLELFAIGRTPVTLGGVFTGVAVAVLFFFAARAANFAIGRVNARTGHAASTLYIVRKLVTYGLIVLGVVIGLNTMGLDLSTLTVFAGALGVGVGLGLQGVVREFVSGLVLIFDRSMGIGDYVELGDGNRGLVLEIGPRAVRVRTNDNVDLAIPNSKFIDGPVINWTLGGVSRRIRIPFSVAYGSDRHKVREVVLAAARAAPFTAPETRKHSNQVWLVGFGDNALNFELVVWPTLEAVKRPGAIFAAYNWAIADALEEAGIEIPFPQRDLHVRSLFGRRGDEALELFNLQASEQRAARARPRSPTDNDAAEELRRSAPPPKTET